MGEKINNNNHGRVIAAVSQFTGDYTKFHHPTKKPKLRQSGLFSYYSKSKKESARDRNNNSA